MGIKARHKTMGHSAAEDAATPTADAKCTQHEFTVKTCASLLQTAGNVIGIREHHKTMGPRAAEDAATQSSFSNCTLLASP